MKNDDIWDISNRPQTQIKLDILRKYLRAWAIIVGEYYPEAYYVDCFAGRGSYHKGNIKNCIPGSPLIGTRTAIEVKNIKAKKGLSFILKIIAVESNRRNADDLEQFIRQDGPASNVSFELKNAEFDNALEDIIKVANKKPAFFFIDPYGIKTISKESLDLIICRNGSTEIFLNYMNMGVQRVSGQLKNVKHENEKIRIKAIKTVSHLNDLFGDMSWADKNSEELLKHFVEKVLSNKYNYVLNFKMPYPDRSGIMYNLLFATNYPAGEKIMKDIMTKNLFKGTLFEKCPFEIDLNIK